MIWWQPLLPEETGRVQGRHFFFNFPKSQEQIQSVYVVTIDKLVGNFNKRFDRFSIGLQLLLLIQNPFLIKDVREISKEVTQTFKWANVRSQQMELIDLQANVALKVHFGVTDPAAFWLQTVPERVFPGPSKVALNILIMFGSTYRCKSSFSTMSIIKTEYHSKLKS